ncbi:MAG: NAD(P)H-hydrate epimerase [Pseudomonadota bacterium]
MRAIERAAIDAGEVTGLELMERAGRGVVEAVFEEWPELAKTSHRAVVLCGPGNNGGDGFVVARLLKEWGWEVEVFLYGDASRLPPDARVNYERWLELGACETNPEKMVRNKVWGMSEENHPHLWIDAVFGIGLSRKVERDVGFLFEQIQASFFELENRPPGKTVSIDLPTGIHADTGDLLFASLKKGPGHMTFSSMGTNPRRAQNLTAGSPLACDMTVTFHLAKLAHFIGKGAPFCGKVVVKGIGLS